ncbi:MAG: Rieske 2Fe-2S domain-containing protein, partial [Alphaproteobacteria bacterium]|nr:Rieske 2Fe-2S domain-containing protein [Alphaproteobacteria bacterium]
MYQRELQRIFGGPAWSYVGLEAEIPHEGDFKRTKIGETSVIVVRGKDQEIHVLKNQCAHRGLEVCKQDYGSNRTFQCPYHQWTYRLNGDLSGVPFIRGVGGQGGMPEDFDRADHGLTK